MRVDANRARGDGQGHATDDDSTSRRLAVVDARCESDASADGGAIRFFLRASARSRLAIRDDRWIESSLIDVI